MSGTALRSFYESTERLFFWRSMLRGKEKGDHKVRSRYPGMVKILNRNKLTLQCLICGQEWVPGGRLYKRNWFCPKGCTEKALKERSNEYKEGNYFYRARI